MASYSSTFHPSSSRRLIVFCRMVLCVILTLLDNVPTAKIPGKSAWTTGWYNPFFVYVFSVPFPYNRPCFSVSQLSHSFVRIRSSRFDRLAQLGTCTSATHLLRILDCSRPRGSFQQSRNLGCSSGPTDDKNCLLPVLHRFSFFNEHVFELGARCPRLSHLLGGYRRRRACQRPSVRFSIRSRVTGENFVI